MCGIPDSLTNRNSASGLWRVWYGIPLQCVTILRLCHLNDTLRSTNSPAAQRVGSEYLVCRWAIQSYSIMTTGRTLRIKASRFIPEPPPM